MSKYIRRNCPNITFIDLWRLEPKSSYCKLKNCGCENYTDCLLKKIVEKCKENIEFIKNNNLPLITATTDNKIIKMLDIEECE